MPGKTTQSSLFGKSGGKVAAAHNQTKDEAPPPDMNDTLPPGINGGVAQLVSCGFDVIKTGDNAGQPCFKAAAVVVHPATAPDGTPLLGRQFYHPIIPICDTPKARGERKTLLDHWRHMGYVLKRLGLEVDKIGGRTDVEVESAYRSAMKDLVDSSVHFRFRTWQGDPTSEFPNPRVNVTWQEYCEWTGEAPSGVEDGTAAAPAAAAAARAGRAASPTPTGRSAVNGPATKGRKGPPPLTAPAADEVEDSTPPADLEFGDLDSLAVQAQEDQDGDVSPSEAQIRIEEMAKAAGLSDEEVRLAPSWGALVEDIRSRGAGDAEGTEGGSVPDEETTEEWTPLVGQVYVYKMADPGNPKARKRAVEVEITKVDEDARTVTLKVLENGKAVTDPKNPRKALAVSWDDLESAE